MVQKFYLTYKNLSDQAKSGWPKIVDYKTVLQAKEANLVSSL